MNPCKYKIILSPKMLFLSSILLLGIQFTNGTTPDPKLRKKLLENYDPMAQPYSTDTNIPMTTTITMLSLNVVHYNIHDLEQTLEIHAWLSMSWQDERLKWSKYLPANQEDGYLHFKKSEIWRPDITLYNTAIPKIMDEFANDAHILVKSNGSIIWVPPIRFITNCQMNFLHWPFDTQECYIKLGSWTFNENEIDLQFSSTTEHSYSSSINIMSYEGHSFPNNTGWIIIDSNAIRTSKKYSCCNEKYVDITYNFKLNRKYFTYAYTIIFPIIMISIINMINFLLPIYKMSRIILGCFNFLTITIYLIYFRLRLPNIDHVPHIVKLFLWNLFVTTINIILTVTLIFYTNWSNRNGINMMKTPEWAKCIINSGIGSILCLNQTYDSDKSNSIIQTQQGNNTMSENRSKNTSNNDQYNQFSSSMKGTTMEQQKNTSTTSNPTANLIDRFTFVLFTFLMLIMLICHLS